MGLVSAIYEKEILFGEGFVVMEHAHENTGIFLNVIFSTLVPVHSQAFPHFAFLTKLFTTE